MRLAAQSSSLIATNASPDVSSSGKVRFGGKRSHAGAKHRLLDTARSGPLYLRQREMATMVVEALRYREQDLHRFELHAYVVMPNHVHILITPHVPLAKLMQSLKRHTAREGNRMLGLTNQPFWQDESYDHLVRGTREFQRIRGYIEMNPVRAGLVCNPEEFPWSSARAD
jgi:putative DNA methylase